MTDVKQVAIIAPFLGISPKIMDIITTYLHEYSMKTALLFDDSENVEVLAQVWTITFVAAALAYIASLITRNMSIVDMMWSVMPAVYCIMYTLAMPNRRSFIIAVLVTVWSLRLSYNLYLKDGYSLKFEDYRWSIVKGRIQTVVGSGVLYYFIVWVLFDLFFVSIYQLILITLFCMPAYYVAAYAPMIDNIYLDHVVTMMWSVCFYFEMQGDYELRVFRANKEKMIADKKKPKDNFVKTGVYAMCRHPNFFGEQGMWLCIWIFSAYTVSGQHLAMSSIGIVLLLLLFQASTSLTESIAMSKYPEYAEYCKTTPKFIPDPNLRDSFKPTAPKQD